MSRYLPRQNVRRISAETFVRWLRKLNLSQTDCATFLNVDPRSVRRWISGESVVPGPAITALEMLLKEMDA